MERYEYLNGLPSPRMVAELAMRHDALVKQLVDAQATIAALQAERDGWVRSREHYYQLWIQAIDERDEMRKERDDFESQLTQRTAELEAAKAIQAIDMKNNNAYREQVANLQTELERVRGELAETGLYLQQERANRDSLAACVDRDVKTIKDLRTLILALPKVEGDVEVYHHESGLRHSVVARPANKHYSSFDTPEEAGAYAAILKHRQGMEGERMVLHADCEADRGQ